MGLGGKVLAKNMLKGAAKRGAGRTGARLGIALGGKLAGGFGARMGAKLGAQTVGKVAGGALAKSLGKKIPLVGLGLGAVFAAQRAMQGDFLGAGLELASGAASTVPGIGTAGSVGIDAALAARDMGVVPFADGGIISDATLGLVGEKGKEGVFPLEGAEGRKTFLMFGEGILEAQYKNKSKYAKLQAQGLSQYYDKQNGWEKFVDALKNLIPGGGGDDNIWSRLARFLPGGGGGGGGGSGNVDAATIKADTAEKKAFIATVREAEGTAGEQGYNTVYGGAVVPELTKMTLGELYEASKLGGTDRLPERLGGGVIPYKKDRHNSSASGAVQLMPETLQEVLKSPNFNEDTIFSPKTQNEIILHLAALSGVDIENMDERQMTKAGGRWAGLTPQHGQTSRTASDSMALYRKNLAEARKTTPDPQPDPPDGGPLTLDPSEIPGENATPEEIAEYEKKLAAIAKRQAAALKAKQAAAATTGGDWAKSLNLGNAPFIDFGSDNQFRAIKRDSGGYTIMKKGFLGGMTRMETKDQNLGLKDQLIEAAKPKEISSLAPGSTADPNALGIRSQELAMASTGNITTINNINNMSSGANNGGNAPADILPGPGSADIGTFIYTLQETRFS